MNDVIAAIMNRHAIRKYTAKQVPEDVLEQILEAGLYAPSAGNNQYSRIVVSQDPTVNLELGKLSRYMQFKGADPASVAHSISADQPSIQDDFTIKDGFYGAPTVLTLFVQPGQYAHDDAAMMAMNIMLAATSLGVGSCYIGRTDEVFATEYGQAKRVEWGVPDDMVPVCNILLGYRDGAAPKSKPRKPGRIIRA